MTRGDFKIFRCGVPGVEAVESDTRHVFPRHTHEHFGVGVIDRGAQKSHSGRGLVEAGAGDMITVNPGEVHDGVPIGDAGRSWRMLYLDSAVIANATRDISEGKKRTYEFHRPVIRDASVCRRFRMLFSAVTEVHPEKTVLSREELFFDLLPDVMDERPHCEGHLLLPHRIGIAKCLIDDDPAATITLAVLARASGLSRFQVLRGFVRATGLTPHAYLVQRRIDLARRLIARRSTLAEASAAAGFADQSHMTRIFVRKYGITPGAYAEAAH
jgi:AraC-like DNA-binding protein